MAGNRSTFVSPNFTPDVFPTLYDLPPELANDANELQILRMTMNKTDIQNTRMNTLLIELANYLLSPETINHFTDCIYNIENNYLTIYNNFIANVNAQLAKFTNKGAYNSITQYQKWNTVTYSGQTFLALQDNIGHIPVGDSSDIYWQLMAQKGAKGDKGDKGDDGLNLVFKGDYSDAITYAIGDAVQYQGSLWACIATSTGNIPTNTTYWRLAVAKGSSTTFNILRNTYILSSPASNIPIGISGFNSSQDTLVVFQNGTEIEINKQYTINADGISINSIDNSNWQLPCTFVFIVFKTTNNSLVFSDGSMIAAGSITIDKLVVDLQNKINKIGSSTLQTQAQNLSDGLNEINTNLSTHISDNTKHISNAIATNSSNSYAINISNITTYTDMLTVRVKFNAASSGAISLNINGLGAKNVVDYFGNSVTNIRQNLIADLSYEAISGNFILLGKGGGGTATLNDIRQNKTATVDTGQIIGALVTQSTAAQTITPGTTDIVKSAGIYDGPITIKGKYVIGSSTEPSGTIELGFSPSLIIINMFITYTSATGSVLTYHRTSVYSTLILSGIIGYPHQMTNTDTNGTGGGLITNVTSHSFDFTQFINNSASDYEYDHVTYIAYR